MLDIRYDSMNRISHERPEFENPVAKRSRYEHSFTRAPADDILYHYNIEPTPIQSDAESVHSTSKNISVSEQRARLLLDQVGTVMDNESWYIVELLHKSDELNGVVSERIIMKNNDGKLRKRNPGGSDKILIETLKKLRSPYKGASVHAALRKWRSRRKTAVQCFHLGYFASDLGAARSYELSLPAQQSTLRNTTLFRVYERILDELDYPETTITKVTNATRGIVLYEGDASASSFRRSYGEEATPLSIERPEQELDIPQDILELLIY